MQRKYLGVLPLLVLMLGLAIIPVQATNNATPLKAKHTFTGATLTAFDSDYHAKDFLIVSGNQIDLDKVVEGLVIPDDDVSVDLSETSLISDSAIDSDSDFSPTFINNTFNVGVESSAADSHVDAELSGSYADTRMDANVRFNTSAAQTVSWESVLATDENGDGDYEDSADRGYRTSIGGSGQILYWNAMADWNVSDADNYMKLTWSFKTTGANDYDVEIIHYTGSGDSAWSNVDSSGENKITLSLYDTDEEAIALMAGVNELLQIDLGDNPVLSGLNELIVEVGTNNAAAEVDVRINNFCVFSDYPAITDKTDNDDDWDLDGATGGLMDGLWDDNDFLVTDITEGATETYDSTVPLRNKIETSPYAMLQDAKIITFVGNMYYLPSEWSVSSSSKDGYYETTELWTFDTTILDDLQTPSDVLSWTDTYYNMTLSESILFSDYEDFEDDLVAFEFEGTDKVEDLRTLFDAANEDDYKVAYDGTNPDSSTGSSYDFSITYNSDSAYAEEGGIAVTPTADNTLLIIGIGIVAIVGLAGLYAFVQWRQQPKRRKKKK
jgi:hypothetical protein